MVDKRLKGVNVCTRSNVLSGDGERIRLRMASDLASIVFRQTVKSSDSSGES